MLEVHVGDSEQEEDATMLTLLQHFDQARARPVWWLLEELGVPYKIGRKVLCSSLSQISLLMRTCRQARQAASMALIQAKRSKRMTAGSTQ